MKAALCLGGIERKKVSEIKKWLLLGIIFTMTLMMCACSANQDGQGWVEETRIEQTHIEETQQITAAEIEKNADSGVVKVKAALSTEAGEGSELQAKTPDTFDLDKKTVRLNSGYDMPIVGLGTYSLSDEECYNSVLALLEHGGRLIDTAYMYHNEAAVGRAVRDSGIPREEIFVTTKIYPSQFGNPAQAIEDALNQLNIGYIDLMLLHHPGDGDVRAYKVMEQYVTEGKIRSIGLSNWYVKELESFLPQITVMPAVVQNEIHPYYQESDVIPYIQKLGIVTESWYPLGGRGHTKELLGNETISSIAENHGVSSAQVILRWDIQNGVIVMPGSSNPEHIRENLDIFGFELTDDEMEQIKALNRNEKHDWY